MSGIATACLSCFSVVDRWCHITACLGPIGARSRDGIYETTLADNEREAVSDLLGYLENVRCAHNSVQEFHSWDKAGTGMLGHCPVQFANLHEQRAETDFFHGEPLRALSTLVYSENVDLQRSASLTFAEITERGEYRRSDGNDAIPDLSSYPQMYARWIAIPSNLYCSFCKVPISKSNGLPVQHWVISP